MITTLKTLGTPIVVLKVQATKNHQGMKMIIQVVEKNCPWQVQETKSRKDLAQQPPQAQRARDKILVFWVEHFFVL